MVYSNTCKEVVVMVKKKTTEQFKQEVYNLVGDEYTVLGEYKNSKTKVLMRHNRCNTEWEVVPNNFLRGTRCPTCEPNHHEKKTYSQVLKEVKEQVGDHYTLLSNTYVNADSKLTFKHNDCGNVFKMSAYLFLTVGQRCPACRYKRGGRVRNIKSKFEFEDRVKREGGGEYQLLTPYVNSRTDVTIKHLKCGKVYQVKPSKFLIGQRCPYCYGNIKKSDSQFKQEVYRQVDKEYTVLGKYKNNKTKILIRHNKCDRVFKMTPDGFLRGERCPYCNRSKGELMVERILKKRGVKSISQKRFDDCINPHSNRKLPFDFYLPDYNLCIEYDGEQHYGPNRIFDKRDSYKNRQYRDRLKDKYCKDHNIKLIRIPYTESTEEQIMNYLKSKGLDLTMNKVDKFSDVSFMKVNPLDLHGLMVNYHYLHRVVACKYAYGMYYRSQLVGMVTYTHVRKSLASSISPLANKDNTLELSRLYIKDEVSQNLKNITSKFVSWTLRQLKKEQDGNWFIISFADQGMHHTGAIYQATNFLYCGTTDSGIFCYNGPDKKGGKWVKGHHYRFFILRSIKYRYIMFLGSKTFKKQARKTLKFEIEPYPKQDNVHYSVGDTEERLIRDRQENKVYTETELLKAFPNYDWNGDNEEIIKPIKPKVVNKVNKHFAPVYAISTKTNQVYQFESIRSCAETLNVGERNIKHCLADKKGSLGGFVFCRPDDYTPELASELVEKAKKSPKYNHDFIIDGNWVEGMTKVREIVGASRSSIHKAIDVNRREVKGHTIDIPKPKDIAKHYKSVYQPLATYLIS